MEYVELNSISYGFARDFKHNHAIRRSFNQLTEIIFGFSMEDWYQLGLWRDNYIPYSLIHDNQVISNVSINRIEFDIEEERKVGIQIGTVMTEEKYRHRGLNKFIMDHIIREWKNRADFMYLFANDSVLDFYPKFNFEVVKEYQETKNIGSHNSSTSWKKLNMEDQKDVAFLMEMVNETVPISKIAMRNNSSLIMFYCNSYKKNNIFFIEDLNAIAIADFAGDTLYLDDVFSTRPLEINDLIQTISDKSILRVVLGFTSWDEPGYDKHLLKETDTLFVLKDKLGLFRDKQWMFPVLSHA